MSLLCCCIPLAQHKLPTIEDKPFEGLVELNISRASRTVRTLPPEIWEKVLKCLPLHVLWQNARPTCRTWNKIAINIVTTLSLTTIVDVQWHTSEKQIRQRLYPLVFTFPDSPDTKAFSRIARWNLPEFEKSLQTGQRERYKCDNVILLLPSSKKWQNAALFALVRRTERKDVWEFEQLSYPKVDFDESLFNLSWIPRWRVAFRESDVRRSTSSRADVHLDYVSIPLAQFVKLYALTLEEDWPNIERIDGFDKKIIRRSRPNSGILTPRRRSGPAD